MELAPKVPQVVQSPYRAQFVQLFREKYWSAMMMGSTPPDSVFQQLKGELVQSGTAKNGSVKDGSVKDGSVKDGSVKDGSVKDGSVKDGSGKGGAKP
jgi:hypothetical protein